MDRRAFLKSTGLTTLAGLAAAGLTTSASLAGTELSEQSQVLLLTLPEPMPEMDTDLIARRIAEQLEAATDGRLQIVAAPVHEAAALALSPASALIDRNSDWATLMPMLHGLSPQAFDGWLRAGGGAILIEELAYDTQLTAFPVARGATLHGFSAEPIIDGSTLTLAPDARSLLSVDQGVTVYELQSGYGDTPRHTLSGPVAGEPIFLTIHHEAAEALTHADHAVFKTVAAAEYGVASVEADVQAAMLTSVGNLPAPTTAAPTFVARIDTAVTSFRDRLAASSDIARQIIESQNGYRAMTTGEPVDPAAPPLVG